MTALAELDAKVATLSKNAQRVWESVKRGKFYTPYNGTAPKAMAELVEAGVVTTMGRVVTIQAFYVPVGTTPLQLEVYPS